LLTGCTGQVGWELARSLQTLGRVVCARRTLPHPEQAAGPGKGDAPYVDLAQPATIRSVLRHVRPQLIVNAAAYTAVDKAESEVELAYLLNATACGVMAEEARGIGAALLHFSTDYVFDGSGQGPWRETDPTGPLNTYGRSKRAGEEAIAAAGGAHLILRTSWVYGVHGASFVKTILRLAAQRPELTIVNDQHGAPTSARCLADATAQLLARACGDFASLFAEQGGIVHACCQGQTTWWEFAQEIIAQARDRGLPLTAREVRPIPSSDYPTAAQRPSNSRLDCSLLKRRFGIELPHWKAALALCLDELVRDRRTELLGPSAPPSTSTGQTAPAAASPMAALAHPASQTLGHLRTQAARLHPGSWPHLAALPVDDAEPADMDLGVIYTHERYWMPRLLASLLCSGDDLRLRLILVDNASTDGTQPWEAYFSRTRVVRNSQRMGYADNLNRILEASSAPLVLLLNTDMSFDPAEQCLSKMAAFMREHPDCGLSGCRLYHPDGSYAFPARRFQTLAAIAGRRTPLAPLFRKAVDRYLYRDAEPGDVFECDWLSGCFLLLRREAALQVGGFDCQFAKYFEDVDLCLRIAQAGWRVMFNGGTYCYHYEQRSSRKILSHDAWLHFKSYARWVRKWGWTSPARRRAG
jgi:dTDP-4-dehydrorhamnose reductase